MGRSKKAPNTGNVKLFCYWCDKEFNEESHLINHQVAKHFRCPDCRSGSGRAGNCITLECLIQHSRKVHHTELTRVPDAKPGRDSPRESMHIYGMDNVPDEVIQEWGLMSVSHMFARTGASSTNNSTLVPAITQETAHAAQAVFASALALEPAPKATALALPQSSMAANLPGATLALPNDSAGTPSQDWSKQVQEWMSKNKPEVVPLPEEEEAPEPPAIEPPRGLLRKPIDLRLEPGRLAALQPSSHSAPADAMAANAIAMAAKTVKLAAAAAAVSFSAPARDPPQLQNGPAPRAWQQAAVGERPPLAPNAPPLWKGTPAPGQPPLWPGGAAIPPPTQGFSKELPAPGGFSNGPLSGFHREPPPAQGFSREPDAPRSLAEAASVVGFSKPLAHSRSPRSQRGRRPPSSPGSCSTGSRSRSRGARHRRHSRSRCYRSRSRRRDDSRPRDSQRYARSGGGGGGGGGGAAAAAINPAQGRELALQRGRGGGEFNALESRTIQLTGGVVRSRLALKAEMERFGRVELAYMGNRHDPGAGADAPLVRFATSSSAQMALEAINSGQVVFEGGTVTAEFKRGGPRQPERRQSAEARLDITSRDIARDLARDREDRYRRRG